MNRLFGLAGFFLVAAALCGADPSVDNKIKSIRAQYEKIESSLNECRQVKRDLPGESAEGGELTGYYKGASLRKLSAKFFGEAGKALEEYYFVENTLIFVFRAESRYTKPLSGVVATKTEERFYFAAGKLIRLLGTGNQPISPGPATEARAAEMIERAAKYRQLADK